jgi:hypothetical protein
LVLVHAVAPSFGVELAWVHAVALGWLTLVALAVLIHVIPGFTSMDWRGEGAARRAVIVAAVATLALVVSFALTTSTGVVVAAVALSIALLVYTTLAIATLCQPASDVRSAVIARGLTATQIALALTALLGIVLALGYAGVPALLSVAPSHAVLGIVAWLTLLTSGVSVRTFQPLLGARSRWPRAHVAADGALLAGVVIAAATAPWSVVGFRAGVLIGALGALAYIADAVDVLRRASSPHLAVRAFIAASMAWLAVATALIVATSWGSPLAKGAVVVALAGWLGQMVNAHVHHLGVRVLSTFILGDEDETRPWALLTHGLTWSTFAAAQVAVAGTALRAFGAAPWVAWCAGTAGLFSVGFILANAAAVIRRARALKELRAPMNVSLV